MNQIKTLKIGTRGSKLALWQAHHVQSLINQHWPDITTEIVTILTSGDWSPSDGEKRLSERKGGKAQFAKEIEENLLDGRIDIAVHSMKDMDSILPDGLEIACILPREDPRDSVLLRHRGKMDADPKSWPEGITIGTASIRRQAMILARNPSLKTTVLRGNVGTRISKLRGELANDFPEMEATFLAAAGLNRLEMTSEIDHIVPEDVMLPAAAQGAIGIEIASDHAQDLTPILAPLNCKQTQQCITAERAVLRALNGSCRTPIGIYATFGDDSAMTLRAHLLTPDGQMDFKHHDKAAITSLDEAETFGRNIGAHILRSAPEALLKAAL